MKYRCTTCGVAGDLEEGETTESVRPHGEPVCHGTRVVEIGSQEEVELDMRLRAEMYAELGIDPAKCKVIAYAANEPPKKRLEKVLARDRRTIKLNLMKTMTNKLGPFKMFAAADIIACLSTEAKNVKEVKTEHGIFVTFELPEGAPMWKVGQ